MFDKEKIWNSTQLPTLPAVAIQLLELTRDPETEMSQIVELIKTDPAIYGRILQATNSSFFGFSSKVNSIDRAVPLLGTTVVTSLALSFSLSSESITDGPMKPFYQSYWKQSIIHAVAGEAIGKRCSEGLECEYFLAGLLLDIGRLAMLKAIPRDYYPVLVTAESQSRPLHEVEHEFLGLGHAEVTCKLMESWGLPDRFLDGMRFQHVSKETLAEAFKPNEHSLEAGIALSNAIGDYFISSVSGLSIQRIRDIAGHFFGMQGNTVDEFLEEVRERINEAGDLFSVDMSDISEPSEIMSQANQQLLELTMRAQSETLQASARQKEIEREKTLLESKNVELEKKATHDPLTGIFNRAYFDQQLEKVIQRGCDRCSQVAVIFADIDRFKSLNDTYGHQFGDEVLKKFANVVQQCLRSSDIFCRYGGEEFVIIVSRPSEKGVQKLAERVRASVEQTVIEHEGQRVPVTCSFGTGLMMPGRKEYRSGEVLIQNADEALYESKENGRNRVTHRCLLNDEERSLFKEINQRKFSRWLVINEILTIPVVSRVLLQVPPDQRTFGELAVGLKFLEPQQIDELASIQQQQPGRRFGELAIETGMITDDQLQLLLSWQVEPPDRLMNSMIANEVFPAERCEQLFNQYKDSVTKPSAEKATT